MTLSYRYFNRWKACDICHEVVKHRIKLPSDIGYWVCYDCFSYWIEGYTYDTILDKFAKHYRKSLLNS